MKTEDRDRILQLVAHIKTLYHSDYRKLAPMSDPLIKAHALCNGVIASLNQPRRESYCPDCGEFHPVEESGPDFVCAKCRLVLMTLAGDKRTRILRESRKF